MTEERVGVDMGSVRNIVCPRHEQALAADPSVNSLAFPIAVLEAAMADQRTLRACGWDPDTGTLADARLAQDFLLGHTPLCEWVTGAAVEAAWQKARELGRAVPT